MKKPIFNKIVKNFKKNIANTNLSEINKLKTKFPYCELIHKISLIQAHNDDDINFNEILALSSLYSTNRRQLFTIINPKVAATKFTKELNRHNFEEWLQKPLTKPMKSDFEKPTFNRFEKSISDNDFLTTETLAELYFEQGHYERAIQAYNILCLKYPKKSSFFANRIKDIKTKIN